MVSDVYYGRHVDLCQQKDGKKKTMKNCDNIANEPQENTS